MLINTDMKDALASKVDTHTAVFLLLIGRDIFLQRGVDVQAITSMVGIGKTWGPYSSSRKY